MVNKNLEAYYNAWDRFIESWIVIKIREPNCVFQWRLQFITRLSKQVRCRIHDNYGLQFLKFLLVFLQAEIAMRADGKPGMSDEEVRSLTEPLWNPRLIDWLSDVVSSSNHFYFIHLKLKPI